MLPKSRILSALLLGIGVALIVWGIIAPKFVHADGRLPLDLTATTYTLVDTDAQTRVISDPDTGLISTPLERQLHFDVMDPVSSTEATLRVGDTLIRGTDGADQQRLLSAQVSSFRVDRLSGEILSEVAVTNQLASPTVNYEVEGIWLKFPTDAQATTYQVLDPVLRSAQPADFIESTDVDGRTIMHYRQVIDNAMVAKFFADPANTTTLTAEDGGSIIGYLYHDVTRDFWVDQRTGLIVDMSENIDQFYGDRDGEKLQQQLLFDAKLSSDQHAALMAQVADIPHAETARLIYISVIILGGIFVLLGLVGSLGLFSRKESRA